MEFIKENKRTIIICLIMLVLALVIYFIFNRKTTPRHDYEFPEIERYEINEILYLYTPEEYVAKKYLSEYINLMDFYPEKAYELLDDEMKENKFASYDSFKYYIDSLNKSIKVKEYGYKLEKSKKNMYVIDMLGNTFIFREKSLMDYTVLIG